MTAAELIPLHKAAYAEPLKPSRDFGIPSKLLWIPLNQLYIDPRYQRAVGERGRKNIRKIVEGFNWSLFSPLVVGPRAAKQYAVIDGQHRGIAAMTHGCIREVPCMIIRGGVDVEAMAFAIINGQVTSVTDTQIHAARVVAGDPEALAIEAACAAADVKVMKFKTGTTWKPGQTIAIGALRSCLKRYGRDALITAMQCVTQTGNQNPGYVKAPIIHGAAAVLAERKDWCDAGEALFAAVETVGIQRMFAKAEAARLNGGTVKGHFAREFRAVLQRELGEKYRRAKAA